MTIDKKSSLICTMNNTADRLMHEVDELLRAMEFYGREKDLVKYGAVKEHATTLIRTHTGYMAMINLISPMSDRESQGLVEALYDMLLVDVLR